jgi:AraC-like DNA-binding protein
MNNSSIFTPSSIELAYVETRWSYTDVPLHTHQNWELVYHREGVVQSIQNNESFEMRPGMAIVHPPGVKHRDIHSEDWSVYFIQFKVEGKFLWPRLIHDNENRSIERVCDAILREFHGRDYGNTRLLRTLVDELDVLLQRVKVRESLSPSARIVSEAKRILEERYNDPPSVSELASLVGVSHSWLYLHFTDICGVSPKQYLQSVRMKHVLDLLKYTRHTLDWIAASCGFNSVSHLSRQVKAVTGLTPGAFRYPENSLLAKDKPDADSESRF